ncbi:glycosyl hydrolase family 76-domain-containing protein [Kalaharituber pfeilii]|nr:glycosyl hydrolase family 76-domain-containing protein [Kalaharituber pfeilii]
MLLLSLQGGGVYKLLTSALLLLPFVGSMVQAQIPLNLDDPESIKQAASIAAAGMMKEYVGNQPGQIPGKFPDPPYYWWESGAAWGAMVDYWYYTEDTQYNDIVSEGLLWQVGPANNFMPPNASKSLGNDDQCFWALAVIAAAEKKFPDPPEDQPQWLALAQGVFNSQAKRWDTKTCRGGLRWQIFTFNIGFDYKNTVSNGCFFQLGARLARYTNNNTYAVWAERAYNWTVESKLLTDDFRVYDGVDVVPDGGNCSKINILQWSYNAGLYIAGAAYMYNFTSSVVWKERLDNLINAAFVFFAVPEWNQGERDVMIEVACEESNNCNTDQRSFKAYLSRFLALAVKIAPHTYNMIMPKLRVSAQAAARQCKGPPDGTTCSLKWAKDDWRAEYTGLGEQMAALEVIQSNLINTVVPPVTADKGGTSKGDPTAGTDEDKLVQPLNLSPIKTRDRVGAGFLTAIVLSGILGGALWMMI